MTQDCHCLPQMRPELGRVTLQTGKFQAQTARPVDAETPGISKAAHSAREDLARRVELFREAQEHGARGEEMVFGSDNRAARGATRLFCFQKSSFTPSGTIFGFQIRASPRSRPLLTRWEQLRSIYARPLLSACSAARLSQDVLACRRRRCFFNRCAIPGRNPSGTAFRHSRRS
jgi:hypothetical protein